VIIVHCVPEKVSDNVFCQVFYKTRLIDSDLNLTRSNGNVFLHLTAKCLYISEAQNSCFVRNAMLKVIRSTIILLKNVAIINILWLQQMRKFVTPFHILQMKQNVVVDQWQVRLGVRSRQRTAL